MKKYKDKLKSIGMQDEFAAWKDSFKEYLELGRRVCVTNGGQYVLSKKGSEGIITSMMHFNRGIVEVDFYKLTGDTTEREGQFDIRIEDLELI